MHPIHPVREGPPAEDALLNRVPAGRAASPNGLPSFAHGEELLTVLAREADDAIVQDLDADIAGQSRRSRTVTPVLLVTLTWQRSQAP